MIRLFISHASDDAGFVSLLIELLRAALNLPASAIRCTSVDGYLLPGGATTNDELRREVHDAEAFVGVISTKSIRSPYVLFELGARWGAGLQLIPLVTPGTPTSVLGGPLSGLNALRADSAPQLYQLVSELSDALSATVETAASYHRYLDPVIQARPSSSGSQHDALRERTQHELTAGLVDALDLKELEEVREQVRLEVKEATTSYREAIEQAELSNRNVTELKSAIEQVNGDIATYQVQLEAWHQSEKSEPLDEEGRFERSILKSAVRQKLAAANNNLRRLLEMLPTEESRAHRTRIDVQRSEEALRLKESELAAIAQQARQLRLSRKTSGNNAS